MSYTLFSTKTRTAIKRHRCIWCGQTIEAGASYKDERSVYDGSIQRHRWHPECLVVAQEGFGKGEDEFTPYENERPAGTPAT